MIHREEGERDKQVIRYIKKWQKEKRRKEKEIRREEEEKKDSHTLPGQQEPNNRIEPSICETEMEEMISDDNSFDEMW